MDILTFASPVVMPQCAVDAGLSPFRCGRCEHYLSGDEVRFSQIWEAEPLLKCQRCADGFQKGSVAVLPSSEFLLDASNALSVSWFHATCVEDWFEKVTTGQGMEKEAGEFLYVHVGTESASREIAEDKYFRNPREGERIFLYELHLSSGALLSPSLLNDGETWWDFSSVTERTAEALGGDAVRYLNRWESPGSISLLVDARQLEFVSVTQIHSRF